MPVGESDELTVEQAERGVAVFFNDAALGDGRSREEYKAEMSLLLDKSHLSREPFDARGWYLRGNGCLAVGRFHDAVECYEKCLNIQPGHEKAKHNKRYADVLKVHCTVLSQ